MDCKLKVSVITPSYNQAQYLEETILSVLNQTYSNIEYIVIDGGSTDTSADIIRKYESKIAYWISERDRGQAEAINKGFLKSTGDFVCWINSDDIIYPNFVEDRVKQFIANPDVEFIYGDVDQGTDLNYKHVRKGYPTTFLEMLISLDVPIPQQSAMWRTSLLQRIGNLVEKWHVLLDREYFMRVALNAKILYIPGAVAFFRNHNQSKSIAEWSKWADELEIYYSELFEEDFFLKYYGKYYKKAMASMYYECGTICKQCDEIDRMKHYFNKSAKLSILDYTRKRLILILIKIKTLFKLNKK